MIMGATQTQKNKFIQVSIEEYKGSTGIDIREWYLTDGAACPSKKGLRLQVHELSSIISFLDKAEETLFNEGKLVH